jgi:hypothetical protein
MNNQDLTLLLNHVDRVSDELKALIIIQLKNGIHNDLEVSAIHHIEGLQLVFKSIVEQLPCYELDIEDLWWEFLLNEEGNSTYQEFYAESENSVALLTDIGLRLGCLNKNKWR